MPRLNLKFGESVAGAKAFRYGKRHYVRCADLARNIEALSSDDRSSLTQTFVNRKCPAERVWNMNDQTIAKYRVKQAGVRGWYIIKDDVEKFLGHLQSAEALEAARDKRRAIAMSVKAKTLGAELAESRTALKSQAELIAYVHRHESAIARLELAAAESASFNERHEKDITTMKALLTVLDRRVEGIVGGLKRLKEWTVHRITGAKTPSFIEIAPSETSSH